MCSTYKKQEVHPEFWGTTLVESDHPEDQDTDGRLILKTNLK